MRRYGSAIAVAATLVLGACGPQVETPPPEPPSIDSIFPAGWQYESKTDEMSGKVDYTACIMSENAIILLPTAQRAKGRLCLRDNSVHGVDAMMSIPSGGHIDCLGGCSMRVRFDEEPAITLAGVQPSGFANMVIFAGKGGSAAIWRGVSKSSKVRVEVDLYGAGREIFTFKTAGFEKAKARRPTP